MTIAAVLERIKKLRALSTSANAHEATAAAAIANRLIQECRLSEAEIEAAGAEPEETPAEAAEPLAVWRRARVQWQFRLAHALAEHYGVASFSQSAPWTRTYSFHLVGRPSDVQTVRYLYASLTVEITRLAKAHGDRYSFCLGAVRGIGIALRESTESVVTSRSASSSAALILASRRDASEAELARLHPSLGKYTVRRSSVDRDAYRAGIAAGGDLAKCTSKGALAAPSKLLGRGTR